jgi:hypothetical protein
MGERPLGSDALSAQEFVRWYWTKAELIAFARALGVPAGGSKIELTDRIRAHLAGEPPPANAASVRTRLSGPLTATTVIPPGVVLSQALRDWFTEQVGPSFRFNESLRQFLANGSGRTLGEARDHYVATRGLPTTDIAPQFEYNRFVRAWRADHPDGSGEQMRQAWWEHRSTPT